MECKYCKSSRKNENSLRNHERLCKLNPNRQYTLFSDKKFQNTVLRDSRGQNQYTKAKKLGLEKPILSEDTIQKLRISGKKRKHSIESKLKISAAMKKAHKENKAGRLKPYKKYQKFNIDSCNLYVIKIIGENCIKIGITERSIEDRFKRDKFNYEIIYIKNSDGLSISLLEEELKKKYKDKRYIPKEKFSGYTECYMISIIDNVLKDLS